MDSGIEVFASPSFGGPSLTNHKGRGEVWLDRNRGLLGLLGAVDPERLGLALFGGHL